MYGALELPLIDENDSFSIRITNTVRIGGSEAALATCAEAMPASRHR